MRLLLATIALFSITFLASAQGTENPEESVTIAPIGFDSPIFDTITDPFFYDWWEVQLSEGDTISIMMEAFDGLVPLLGIMDEQRELLFRSDESTVAQPDDVLEAVFKAPQTGLYLIIASRDGNQNGITTGTYRLTVSQVGRVTPRENNLLEVEFRCTDMLVTNAMQLELEEDSVDRADGFVDFYAITVFGLDGFTPVIRANAPQLRDTPLDCTKDDVALPNSEIALPDLPPFTFLEDDESVQGARYILQNTASDVVLGRVFITIGSLDGAKGRFIVILEGLQIVPRSDEDIIGVRLAPFVKEQPLRVYMLGNANTRLDPVLEGRDTNGEIGVVCDDSGRGECEASPLLNDLRVFIADGGGITHQADRFDASITLQPMTTDSQYLLARSRNNETSGAYTLILVSELP